MRSKNQPYTEQGLNYINYGIAANKKKRTQFEVANENLLFCHHCAIVADMTYGRYMALPKSKKTQIIARVMAAAESQNQKPTRKYQKKKEG